MDLLPEYTAADPGAPAPELPVVLDMPGKVADFLRAAELGKPEPALGFGDAAYWRDLNNPSEAPVNNCSLNVLDGNLAVLVILGGSEHPPGRCEADAKEIAQAAIAVMPDCEGQSWTRSCPRLSPRMSRGLAHPCDRNRIGILQCPERPQTCPWPLPTPGGACWPLAWQCR
ncbi:hypothetical protein ACFXKW_31825 [Streptomyces sp. NPDC059193]|uniref:hypothetical protein n=1 Tax=Streptomyces sp. NPDC059193 TaxID=3346763 RepID=UPI00367C3737